MLRFFLNKIALIVPTLIGITICAFGFVRLLPGDPILALAGEHGVTPQRYELLKVQDPKKRKRLAAQVASGELSLVKLREKIEGRRSRTAAATPSDEPDELVEAGPLPDDDGDAANGWNPTDRVPVAMSDDSLVNARHQLSDAVEDLVSVLRAPDVMRTIPDIDRVNLAKYLTITKLKIENAIALVRSEDSSY